MLVQKKQYERMKLITFNDLTCAYSELKNSIAVITNDLQNTVSQLLKKYEESLGLPADKKWRNIGGDEGSIISLYKEEDGELVEVSSFQLPVDKRDYSISFFIKTVVDGSLTGGDAVFVKAKIYRQKEQMFINVGDEGSLTQCQIFNERENDKFDEVCEVIKTMILEEIKAGTP